MTDKGVAWARSRDDNGAGPYEAGAAHNQWFRVTSKRFFWRRAESAPCGEGAAFFAVGETATVYISALT